MVAMKWHQWAVALTPDSRRAPPELTVETVTEFSPRECVFVDGKWVQPASR
ncbi:MAG: hypothetical protein NTV55_13450 [Planctomycetota bacterium]|nr:hypothetical protein [Planctomycetota bacterium]